MDQHEGLSKSIFPFFFLAHACVVCEWKRGRLHFIDSIYLYFKHSFLKRPISAYPPFNNSKCSTVFIFFIKLKTVHLKLFSVLVKGGEKKRNRNFEFYSENSNTAPNPNSLSFYHLSSANNGSLWFRTLNPLKLTFQYLLLAYW